MACDNVFINVSSLTSGLVTGSADCTLGACYFTLKMSPNSHKKQKKKPSLLDSTVGLNVTANGEN